jgi:predicted ATPase
MLKRLKVERFKSWNELDIEFGQVTGLFGTNSSGKSSIFQFLGMLKQTKDSTDRGLVLDFGGENQIVNLGSFTDVVHQHDTKQSIEWSLWWGLDKPLKISNPSGASKDTLFTGQDLSLSAAVSWNKTEIKSSLLKYLFDDHSFVLKQKEGRASEYDLSVDGRINFDFKRQKGRVWRLPSPVKTHLFPDQVKTYHQNADFLGFFEERYELMVDNIFYLGPLREYPKRQYQWSGTSPIGVGFKGERTVDAILSATSKGEIRNLGGRTHYKPFQEIIAHWLKELGLISSFEIKEVAKGSSLYQAVVKTTKGSAEVFLTDVGIGVSQVIPALVLLYYVPEGSTILMEQPEIHLHPSVQSGLADVIMQVAKHRNLQVIVESHSEHLLRRFQRRVAEEAFQAEDMKLYFCNTHNGASRLDDLEIDGFGQILNWPPHFFGDEMAEIAETQKAMLTRKIQAQSRGE